MRFSALLFGLALAAACRAPAAPTAPAPVDWRPTANTRAEAEAAQGALAGDGAAPSPPSSAASTSEETKREIVVAKGESLFGLSQTHRVALRALIEANGLAPPFKLAAGQRLKLPPPNRHIVASGDTLYAIARRFRVDLRSLALMNGLKEPYVIAPGQSIELPALARDWEAAANHSEAPPPAAKGEAGPFSWPIEGVIIDRFAPQGSAKRRDGVAIAAKEGAPVRATAAGEVVYAGDELAGYGQLLLIRHAEGWISAYAHNRALKATLGQKVAQGEPIAEAGATGSVATAQLHFELRRDGRPVDPLSLLPARAS